MPDKYVWLERAARGEIAFEIAFPRFEDVWNLMFHDGQYGFTLRQSLQLIPAHTYRCSAVHFSVYIPYSLNCTVLHSSALPYMRIPSVPGTVLRDVRRGDQFGLPTSVFVSQDSNVYVLARACVTRARGARAARGTNAFLWTDGRRGHQICVMRL
eukprot:COSAG02_NODE_2731_length_8142_cov_5.041775_5_plen_155_part_00